MLWGRGMTGSQTEAFWGASAEWGSAPEERELTPAVPHKHACPCAPYQAIV